MAVSPLEATSDEELCRKGAANFGERRMGSRRDYLALEAVRATSTAGCVHYNRRCSPAHV